ncbi:MAG TPA: hypothetical protein VFU13_24100 [Steroidobacteraceae bacterium]|nr:hypothetical protein [Steroidobacteraceae bacterium]
MKWDVTSYRNTFRRTLFVFFSAVVLAATASAECSATGCWSVHVEELYPEAGGGAWIRTSGNEMLANCTANSGVYLRLEGGEPGFKEIYATLLAAQLADKLVNIRIQEGSGNCRVLYVTLNRNTW